MMPHSVGLHPVAASWIDALAAALVHAPSFRGYMLRPARRDDERFLFALHRDAMREYVEQTWGWNEAWQRRYFAEHYVPARNAIIVGNGPPARDVGRISVTRHWRKVFLRDIELVAAERNHGLGTALIDSVMSLAEAHDRYVELLVLKCNPAQHLYARLGFVVIDDDGARLRMRSG